MTEAEDDATTVWGKDEPLPAWMGRHEHTQAPTDPTNGDRFTCGLCGCSAEFVVVDDGIPGEWVDTTPSGVSAPTGDPT